MKKLRKYLYLFMLVGVLAVAACTSGIDKPVACTEDAKVCSDGTTLVRDADNNCEFPACPDEKTYVSNDPEECKLIKFMCVEGKRPFFDETGCGCEPIAEEEPTDGKLKATDCTAEERNKACTKEYMPVCGWFGQNIQCIKYPCANNYGNKCMACSDENVAYWTEGECPTDSSGSEGSGAAGTVPAGSQNPCTDIGGEWDSEFNECLGVSAEQCQEIGGVFEECASACRNNPNAEMCTLQCVQVCKV